jgi:hypothetical protein
VLVALGLVVLVFWPRLNGVELTAALMLAFLVVTAGFGSQYLLWPVALLMITGGWRAWVYLPLAAGYAVFFYLVYLPAPSIAADRVLVWGSVLVIAAALLACPGSGCAPNPGPPASGRAGAHLPPPTMSCPSDGASFDRPRLYVLIWSFCGMAPVRLRYP